MRNKYLSGIIAFLLLFSSVSLGLAEAQTIPPTVENVMMESGGNCLSYPQLSGWQDEAVQSLINDDIVLSANVTSHMITFATLTPDSNWGLKVTYEAYVTDRVASFVISAEGKMPNNRQGQTNTALTYDLTTGQRIEAKDIFADPAYAQQWLEDEALRTLGEEISDYEDSAVLLPLPIDSISLHAHGLTFWYTQEQFKTVDGRAGACYFDYAEIQHLLNLDPEGLPVKLGMVQPEHTQVQQQEAIWATLREGKLAQLPVSLGDSMAQVVDTYGLSRTPDEFPGGRYFVMEHPVFRSIYLISDAMEDGYEHSVLEGIQLRRGSFCGILVGQAQWEDVHNILGDPYDVIEITENMAYDYRLPAGNCRLYREEGRTLRFYFDESELLVAVQLDFN